MSLVGAVVIGGLTAVQARVNGQLGEQLGEAFVAAAISFGSGLLILIAVCLLVPAGRRGFRTLVGGLRAGDIPWWMVAGGAAGAFTVATQGLAVAIIGVALFTVGIVGGQIVFGLVLDRAGFGPSGVVPVTVPRLVGGALALVAVGVSLTGGSAGKVPLWMLVLPFLAGMGVAWQGATNGRLRVKLGTPLTATLVNFIGGTLLLAVAAAIQVVVAGPPRPLPASWWLYIGGALGVVYIFLSASIVARTGVLLLTLGIVVGQLTMSVALDVAWPTTASPDLGHELLTAVVALMAVLVAVLPWRWLRGQGMRER